VLYEVEAMNPEAWLSLIPSRVLGCWVGNEQCHYAVWQLLWPEQVIFSSGAQPQDLKGPRVTKCCLSYRLYHYRRDGHLKGRCFIKMYIIQALRTNHTVSTRGNASSPSLNNAVILCLFPWPWMTKWTCYLIFIPHWHTKQLKATTQFLKM
jgi:hypothetical protein